MQRYNLDKSSLIFAGLLLYSGLASYLIIQNSFPYIGISFIFIILGSLTYYLKQPKYIFDKILLAFILVFSIFISIRTNELVTFLDIVGILYLGAIMVTNKTNTFNFKLLFFSPFIALNHILTTRNKFHFNKELIHKPFESRKNIKTNSLFLSLFITIGLLIVIVPLLASTNPFFDKLVGNVLHILNLGNLFNYIFGDFFATNVGRLILTFILCALSLRLVTYSNDPRDDQPHEDKLTLSNILLLPKVVVSIVILVFFFTQLQLYLASADTLKALNYSNARYVNEVFAQLCVVSFIIFLLIYNDKNRTNIWHKVFTHILVAEGIFLALIGLKSDLDYTTKWGFTFKRLYGYTGIFWITSAFGIFGYKYAKSITDSQFAKTMILLSAVTLSLVNILNFDYLVYNYNQSRTYKGIDYEYLARLSPDSLSYRKQLNLITLQDKLDKQKVAATYYPLSQLLKRIENLQNKYKYFDIRGFNLNEYIQYLEIKDINIKAERQKQQELEKEIFNTQPFDPGYRQDFDR